MTKSELKRLIKQVLNEAAMEGETPEGLRGAVVFRVMNKDGKVYIQLRDDNTGKMFDAVLV